MDNVLDLMILVPLLYQLIDDLESHSTRVKDLVTSGRGFEHQIVKDGERCLDLHSILPLYLFSVLIPLRHIFILKHVLCTVIYISHVFTQCADMWQIDIFNLYDFDHLPRLKSFPLYSANWYHINFLIPASLFYPSGSISSFPVISFTSVPIFTSRWCTIWVLTLKTWVWYQVRSVYWIFLCVIHMACYIFIFHSIWLMISDLSFHEFSILLFERVMFEQHTKCVFELLVKCN